MYNFQLQVKFATEKLNNSRKAGKGSQKDRESGSKAVKKGVTEGAVEEAVSQGIDLTWIAFRNGESGRRMQERFRRQLDG